MVGFVSFGMVENLNTLDVLLIDDEDAMRTLAKRIFSSMGAKITTAKDGQEGIAKYRKSYDAGRPYNLVVTDLKMPNANGADVTRTVKQLHPQTKVIVITGFEANQEYAALTIQLGELKPDAVLSKPYSVNQLKRDIAKVMSGEYLNPIPQS